MQLLPYLELRDLYNAYNSSVGSEGPTNAGIPDGFIVNSTVFQTQIGSMNCPSDSGPATFDVASLPDVTLSYVMSKGTTRCTRGTH